eukprot:TRINITY_DN111761_c0_g1_i1.p1 TRINITY_DN111761_c0_g1~~TRINITY_DN111761_c0_g1_i1.p1  ORF type:complete len:439 (-),score=32.28 TRINITY_DN111761_c0_g1_i1:365-1681(-)
MSGFQTVMLKNLPSRIRCAELRQIIDDCGFADTYNFFYMPVRVARRQTQNIGYAFLNFKSADTCERFQEFGRSWQIRNRSVEVVLAHVQGLAELEKHFASKDTRRHVTFPVLQTNEEVRPQVSLPTPSLLRSDDMLPDLGDAIYVSNEMHGSANENAHHEAGITTSQDMTKTPSSHEDACTDLNSELHSWKKTHGTIDRRSHHEGACMTIQSERTTPSNTLTRHEAVLYHSKKMHGVVDRHAHHEVALTTSPGMSMTLATRENACTDLNDEPISWKETHVAVDRRAHHEEACMTIQSDRMTLSRHEHALTGREAVLYPSQEMQGAVDSHAHDEAAFTMATEDTTTALSSQEDADTTLGDRQRDYSSEETPGAFAPPQWIRGLSFSCTTYKACPRGCLRSPMKVHVAEPDIGLLPLKVHMGGSPFVGQPSGLTRCNMSP